MLKQIKDILEYSKKKNLINEYLFLEDRNEFAIDDFISLSFKDNSDKIGIYVPRLKYYPKGIGDIKLDILLDILMFWWKKKFLITIETVFSRLIEIKPSSFGINDFSKEENYLTKEEEMEIREGLKRDMKKVNLMYLTINDNINKYL